MNQNTFGLLYKWPVTNGHIYAQPLAVNNLQGVTGCQSPCNALFVATEQDYLYAFNVASTNSSGTTIWQPLNLAAQVSVSGVQGQAVYCPNTPNNVFEACTSKDPATGEAGPFSGTYIGITGTPVIDMSATPHPILYVVGAVCFDSAPPCNNASDSAGYYLFAVDIVTGKVLNSSPATGTQVNGTVSGYSPGQANKCTSDYYTPGKITFNPGNNPNAHLQRSALLLLSVGGKETVYVAFADLPEYNNGWIFGYQLQNNGNGNYSFSQAAIFATTPYGAGAASGDQGLGRRLTPTATSTWQLQTGPFSTRPPSPDHPST